MFSQEGRGQAQRESQLEWETVDATRKKNGIAT